MKTKRDIFGDDRGFSPLALTYEDRKRKSATVPSCLNMVSLLLDRMTSNKYSVAKLYFYLWLNQDEQSFIRLVDKKGVAMMCGLNGDDGRNLRAVNDRLQALVEVGAIKTEQLGNTRHYYVFMVDPYEFVDYVKKGIDEREEDDELSDWFKVWYEVFSERYLGW